MNYKKSSLLIFLLMIFIVSFSATVNINALNGSTVFLNGSMNKIVSGNEVQLDLNEGSYTIKVSKNGYTDYIETINISEDQNYILKVEQNPLSRIKFNNKTDIKVTYEYQNKTFSEELNYNNAYIDVPSSITEIDIFSDGYQDETLELDLLPFDEKNIELSLLKDNYFILKSNPSNANIYSDNKLIGKTPMEISDQIADSLTLKKEGFIPLDIVYNGEKTLDVDLTNGVNLSIESVPSGAAIYNGEDFIGVTPFNSTVESGKYNLKVTYLGFNTKDLNIDINHSTYNNYKVILENKMKKIELFNSEDVELNIDGNYLGSDIDILYLNNSEHIMKIKNSDKVYSIILSKDIGDHIDFKNNTFINVISGERKTFSINSKTYNTPKTIKLDMLADTQYFTLNTVNKSYNLKLKSGNGYDIFLDNSSAIFFSSNIKNANLYVDGNLLMDKIIVPTRNKSVALKSSFENKTSNESVSLKENETIIQNFNINRTYPVRIDSSQPFIINDKNYTSTPYYVYLKSGANVVEYKGLKVVFFIDGPEYLNLDSIF
ncbi:MAG: PEGA domain-containing protein [Thermotogota bacterium]